MLGVAIRRAVVFVGLAAVACSNGTEPEPVTTLSIASGGDQTGRVGEELDAPIGVTALDSRERAVAGARLTLIAEDGGQVTPATAETGADGSVVAVWQLGTGAGPQSLVVHVAGNMNVKARVGALAQPGAAAMIAVAPDTSRILRGVTVQAQAEGHDAFGNAIPGGDIRWSSSNTAVVTVDQSGRFTGVAAGTAYVVASAGAAADSVHVQVIQYASSRD